MERGKMVCFTKSVNAHLPVGLDAHVLLNNTFKLLQFLGLELLHQVCTHFVTHDLLHVLKLNSGLRRWDNEQNATLLSRWKLDQIAIFNVDIRRAIKTFLG